MITSISDTETGQLTEGQKQNDDAINNGLNISEIITKNLKSDAEYADTEALTCDPVKRNIYFMNEGFLSYCCEKILNNCRSESLISQLQNVSIYSKVVILQKQCLSIRSQIKRLVKKMVFVFQHYIALHYITTIAKFDSFFFNIYKSTQIKHIYQRSYNLFIKNDI